MIKYLLFLALFTATGAQAQTGLEFNKRFVECEDKWVAFQSGKDSTHVFGFIYIDAQAGLTLEYTGNFSVSANGSFIPYKLDSTSMKIRLQPNRVLVALIPESKFAELGITAVPDWLKYYKEDSGTVERLYKWGFMYNGWDQCAKGLSFLEKAQKIDPKYKGLEVELAYSYNCLEQYDKAEAVLQSAIATNPADAYVNKELIYTFIKSGQLEKAAEQCRNAIKICKDTRYNGENCYNLLHSYYGGKDKTNFFAWLDEARKWTKEHKQFTAGIDSMEKELRK